MLLDLRQRFPLWSPEEARTAACGGSAAAPAVSREAHGHHFSRGLRGGDGVGCGGKERGQDWSCGKDVRNRSDRDPVLTREGGSVGR